MIKEKLKPLTTDALLYFADQVLDPQDESKEGNEVILTPRELSPGEKQDAVQKVARWLTLIQGEIARQHYIDEIYKQHKGLIGKKTNLTNTIGQIFDSIKPVEEQSDNPFEGPKLPEGVTQEDVYRDGFYQQIAGGKTGIYFRRSKAAFSSVSNFVIEPLFHKPDRDENCRIIKINDGHETQIVEMPSAALLNRDSFRKFLFDNGAYFFEGSQQDLDKINMALLKKFPRAYELKELGWQPEGFFAYYNYAYNGVLKKYDASGLVEHEKKLFYSPAVSQAYAQDRQTNDMFENDRYLEYSAPPCTFIEWAELVCKAYPDHKELIIGGALLALHRDIHFSIDQNCPHVYFYGPSESGKTKAAQTLSNLFFKDLPGFALSTGTDNAFAQRLGRYRNTPVILNEFDEHMVDPKRFNAIKNAYDGEGRERGRGLSKNKTETQKVAALLILVGQYLITSDDNSNVNRSLIGKFKLLETRPEAQIKAYIEIKDMEKKGLGGVITELMPYRKEVEKNYYPIYHKIKKEMGEDMRGKSINHRDRVLQNYAAIPAFWQIFEKHFKLPLSYKQIYDWAYNEIVQLSEQITNTDILQEFWNALMNLVDQRVIRQNEHFKRESVRSIDVTVTIDGVRQKQTIHFPDSTNIMYIQLPVCHVEYEKLQRTRGKKSTIEKSNLENYIKDRDYFIGWVHSTKFKIRSTDIEGGSKVISKTRSAFIIDIEKAGIEGLFTEIDYEETPSEPTPDPPQTPLPEPVKPMPDPDDLFNVEKEDPF